MTTESQAPAKRVNRSEGTHEPYTATDAQDAALDEQAARLRNVSARVRKSVTEGYVMGRSVSASTSPHAPTAPTNPMPAPNLLSEARIFRSANDTLREVYSTLPGDYMVPQSSPNKRERARSEEPDCDTEMQISGSDAAEHSVPTFAGFDDTRGKSRPVKPLKKSARQFTQTRSLPAGSLQFSSDLRPRDPLDIKPMEDMDF